MVKSGAYKVKTGWIMLFGLFCLAFIYLNNDNGLKQESVDTAIQVNAERLQQNVSLPARYALVSVQVPVAFPVSLPDNHTHDLLTRSFQQSKRSDILIKVLQEHYITEKTMLPFIRSVCPVSTDDPTGLS